MRQGIMQMEGINTLKKKSSDLIGILTRNLPACSMRLNKLRYCVPINTLISLEYRNICSRKLTVNRD
jgi:hypothetical protein